MRRLVKPTRRLVNALAQNLPASLKASVRSLLSRLEPVQGFRRWVFPQPAGLQIISFPKCGRTWLLLMLSRSIQLHFDYRLEQNVIDIKTIYRKFPLVPPIDAVHDGNPHLKRPEELDGDKSRYADASVVFLVRDPRDVMVSLYFEHTKRVGTLYGDHQYQGDISSFIREESGGLMSLIRFHNLWAEGRSVPQKFMLLHYEDLHADPHLHLRQVLDFMGLSEFSDEVVNAAVEYTRFENMQRMERREKFRGPFLRPGDVRDPESYKTRRGVIGGYVDYLSSEDIEYIDAQLHAHLDPYFGYT